jgi:hypothetical protein
MINNSVEIGSDEEDEPPSDCSDEEDEELCSLEELCGEEEEETAQEPTKKASETYILESKYASDVDYTLNRSMAEEEKDDTVLDTVEEDILEDTLQYFPETDIDDSDSGSDTETVAYEDDEETLAEKLKKMEFRQAYQHNHGRQKDEHSRHGQQYCYMIKTSA